MRTANLIKPQSFKNKILLLRNKKNGMIVLNLVTCVSLKKILHHLKNTLYVA